MQTSTQNDVFEPRKFPEHIQFFSSVAITCNMLQKSYPLPTFKATFSEEYKSFLEHVQLYKWILRGVYGVLLDDYEVEVVFRKVNRPTTTQLVHQLTKMGYGNTTIAVVLGITSASVSYHRKKPFIAYHNAVLEGFLNENGIHSSAT